MNPEILQQLEDAYDEFVLKYNELQRAKNEKERKRINSSIELLKIRMIEDCNLMQYDPYIRNGSYDDFLFKRDVRIIIRSLNHEIKRYDSSEPSLL